MNPEKEFTDALGRKEGENFLAERSSGDRERTRFGTLRNCKHDSMGG